MTLQTSYFPFTETLTKKTVGIIGSELQDKVHITADWTAARLTDGKLYKFRRHESGKKTSKVKQNAFDVLVFDSAHDLNAGEFIVGEESGAEGEVTFVPDYKTVMLSAPTQMVVGEKCLVFDSKDEAESFGTMPDDALVSHTDTADGKTYTCTGADFKGLFGTVVSCGESFNAISPPENSLIVVGRSTWDPDSETHSNSYAWTIDPSCPIFEDTVSASDLDNIITSSAGSDFYKRKRQWKDTIVSYPSPAIKKEPRVLGEETWTRHIRAGTSDIYWPYRVKCNDYGFDPAKDMQHFYMKYNIETAMEIHYRGHQCIDTFNIVSTTKGIKFQQYNSLNNLRWQQENSINPGDVYKVSIGWVRLSSSSPNYVSMPYLQFEFTIDKPYVNAFDWYPLNIT